MATYVQKAANILNDKAPHFMDLDSICTPPVNFSDALKRARETTNVEISKVLANSDMSKVLPAIIKETSVTFSYLLMQLHVRGSQQFWEEVNHEQVQSYLTFRVIEMYADVLTHIQNVHYEPVSALEALISNDTLDTLADLYKHTTRIMQQQRKTHDSSWKPDEESVVEVMDMYTQDLNQAAAMNLGKKILIGASVLGVVAIAAFVVLRKR
eukprot:m.258799 g.258799  ORF g.258799 m.258799 type:complete len:211 (+) comp37103_c0_seq1:206-838(+)